MLENFTYTENITAYGTGINLKLGAIMRVGNNTKIGGAIHSPSYISMEEEYSTSVVTEFRTLEENVKFVEIWDVAEMRWDVSVETRTHNVP